MKIKLRLNQSTKESIIDELEEKSIEITDDASLILTEEDYTGDSIECRDEEGIVILDTEDICYMESVGHDVYVNPLDKRYKTKYRVYQLAGMLPSDAFIRISNAVMISCNSIGFFGFRISVTSNSPSSNATFFPVIPRKPATDFEFVTIPIINSSSITSPSCVTLILYEGIFVKRFAPSNTYAA